MVWQLFVCYFLHVCYLPCPLLSTGTAVWPLLQFSSCNVLLCICMLHVRFCRQARWFGHFFNFTRVFLQSWNFRPLGLSNCCACQQKWMVDTIAKNLEFMTLPYIMIFCIFKFAAQDNRKRVFLVCVPSGYGEGQIPCAGQQKQLANVPIHWNIQFRWQAQWIWVVPNHWQGQWKWMPRFKFVGRAINSTPFFWNDVVQLKNSSAAHDDIEFIILTNLEDTKILTGLTKPTEPDLRRH